MKMKKLLVVSISCLCLLAACASGPKVKKEYDYVISDMSSSKRPEWTDSTYIIKMNAKNDGYRYYIGENDNASSKISIDLCRSSAELRARHDFAAAVANAIKTAYTEAASSRGQVVRSQAEVDRELNVSEIISGAEKYADYWEQRSHTKKLGADKDHKSYYCATLVRMKSEAYDSVIQNASNRMIESMKAPGASDADIAGFKREVASKAVATPLSALYAE